LRTEVQDLESARANLLEAEAALRKIEESVDNSTMLNVMVSLIKNPTSLKSRSELLESVHAILARFKTYLETSSSHIGKRAKQHETSIAIERLYKLRRRRG
jgi:hypothetical protein